MGINLVTFAASTVTPQDDALIYESALTGSGLIYGGEVTIKSANVLHVAAGHGALCGRKFTIEATDVPVSLTASGTDLGRIYIHMDLSDTDEPITLAVETGASLTPVQQDSNVNINNGVYEVNLSTFDVDTSTISNLADVRPFITPCEDAYTTEDATEASVDGADYIPFYDTSAGKTKKVLASNFGGVTVDYTGTASASAVRYQRINAGGNAYEINGTKYMEQTQTLSTSVDTVYTFTNAAIAADSVIEPYADIFGIVPTAISVSSGSCSVTIPKQDSAVSMLLRIYIK